MSEEIPYNPPGQDEYIREGARHNQRLLDKWKKENPGKTTEDWLKSFGFTPPSTKQPSCPNCDVPCLPTERPRAFECPKCHEIWHRKPTREECLRVAEIVRNS